MTIEVKHKFQSAKADTGDASLIRPSNWNDTHNIEMAGQRLLGRSTPGQGDAQEITIGSALEFDGGTLNAKEDTTKLNKDASNIGDDTAKGAFRTAIGAMASSFTSFASKATPVDADELILGDSAAAFGLKKLTIANLKNWILALFPINKFYESVPQGIVSSGSATLAHGLGKPPKLVQAYIKCGTAEHGYSVGDETPINISLAGDGGMRGIAIVVDTTNIFVRFASENIALRIINKSTGAIASPTNGNWSLIIRAWA